MFVGLEKNQLIFKFKQQSQMNLCNYLLWEAKGQRESRITKQTPHESTRKFEKKDNLAYVNFEPMTSKYRCPIGN